MKRQLNNSKDSIPEVLTLNSDTQSSMVLEKDEKEKRNYNAEKFVKEGLAKEVNLSRLEQLALPKRNKTPHHHINPWRKIDNLNLSETY